MQRELGPNELNVLLRRWYTPQDLEGLSRWDPDIVEHDIYSTADVILRRRDDEEAVSARTTLQLTRSVSRDWPVSERVTYILKAALEVLGDDRSRKRFKEELEMTLAGRHAGAGQRPL